MKEWTLLKNRKIIDLIIGDREIVKYAITRYKMPYMTARNICEFSFSLGLKLDISQEKKSRWQYMNELLDYIIVKNKVNLFFKNIIDLKRFEDYLADDYIMGGIQEQYWEIINSFFQEKNKILLFDKCHIEYNLQTFKFTLVDDESDIELITDKLENIDVPYIRRLREECYNVIKLQDYDNAITKARTLIEEVLIKGIEKKQATPSESGKVNELYKEFKTLYKMHIDKDMDTRIKMLLSGLEKILSSISEMRNKNSDSHGAGDKRIANEEAYTTLFVNASITMSEFLLFVMDNNK